jgi:hypothetical protein
MTSILSAAARVLQSEAGQHLLGRITIDQSKRDREKRLAILAELERAQRDFEAELPRRVAKSARAQEDMEAARQRYNATCAALRIAHGEENSLTQGHGRFLATKQAALRSGVPQVVRDGRFGLESWWESARHRLEDKEGPAAAGRVQAARVAFEKLEIEASEDFPAAVRAILEAAGMPPGDIDAALAGAAGLPPPAMKTATL